MFLTHYSSGSERMERKPTNKLQINYSKEGKLSLFSWVFLEVFPIVSKLAEREVLSPKLSIEFKLSLVWGWKGSLCFYELDWKAQTLSILTFIFFLKCYKEKQYEDLNHISTKKEISCFILNQPFKLMKTLFFTLNWENVLGKSVGPSLIPKIWLYYISHTLFKDSCHCATLNCVVLCLVAQ